MSCVKNNQKEDNNVLKDCKNKLALISSFDSLPIIEKSFFKAYGSRDEIREVLYDSSSLAQDLKFNSVLFLDSVSDIKVTLQIKDYPPSKAVTHYPLIILQNWENQIYADENLIDIDSIRKRVFEYYIDFKETWKYENNAQIWLRKDDIVDSEIFNKIGIEIIYGYLEFADSVSLQVYSKLIHELSDEELKDLASSVPLNLPIVEFIEPPKE